MLTMNEHGELYGSDPFDPDARRGEAYARLAAIDVSKMRDDEAWDERRAANAARDGYNAAKAARKRGEDKAYEMTCAVCGHGFRSRVPHARYCSQACKAVRAAEKSKERYWKGVARNGRAK